MKNIRHGFGMLSGLVLLCAMSVRADLYLVFDTALAAHIGNPGGQFLIDLELDGKTTNLYHRSWGAKRGIWLPQAINLSDYAGRNVVLQFKTMTMYSYLSQAFYGWGRPRIVRGDIADPAHWEVLEDLTESFRTGVNGRRWGLDPHDTSQVLHDGYDCSSGDGYQVELAAGPESMPCLFGHPYYDSRRQGFGGYEFKVSLPVDIGVPETVPVVAEAKAWSDQPRVLNFRSETYMSGCKTDIDIDAMRLCVNLDPSGVGYAFAGMEFSGMVFLRGKLDPAKSYQKTGDNPMAGIVVDYFVDDHFAKRLWLVFWPGELPSDRYENRAPTWHLRLNALTRTQEYFRRTEMAPLTETNLNLDLRQWAPPGWNGKVWIGLALQDAGPLAQLGLRFHAENSK